MKKKKLLNRYNELLNDYALLDEDNRLLQDQVKALRLKNAELKATAGDWQRAYNLAKPLEYNYASWHPSNYNSSYKYQSIWQEELDLDQ
jgi:hypothetical protein